MQSFQSAEESKNKRKGKIVRNLLGAYSSILSPPSSTPSSVALLSSSRLALDRCVGRVWGTDLLRPTRRKKKKESGRKTKEVNKERWYSPPSPICLTSVSRRKDGTALVALSPKLHAFDLASLDKEKMVGFFPATQHPPEVSVGWPFIIRLLFSPRLLMLPDFVHLYYTRWRRCSLFASPPA